MGSTLRLLGSQMSPYSVKLRSYLLYKGIPFEWIERGRRNEQLFQRHAKVQLIPLVIFPDGTAMQDTTPIIEKPAMARSDQLSALAAATLYTRSIPSARR